MGAKKQKWTAQEEAAIRGGVEKYGPGKWRAIQRDPQFGPFLTSRSNIDLKDKWRNLTANVNGLGLTRVRKSLARKSLGGSAAPITLIGDAATVTQLPSLSPDRDSKPPLLSGSGQEEAAAVTPVPSLSPDGDSKPRCLSRSGQKSSDQKSLGPRYDDNFVLELKDMDDSGNASIARYIDERCQVLAKCQGLLPSKLKALDLSENLVEKQSYEVPANDDATGSPSQERPAIKSTGPIRRPEGLPDEIRRTPQFPTDPAKNMRGYMNMEKGKTVADAEVVRPRMKRAEEAARVAMEAFAEAEIATAAADQAAREADAAEAEADAAEAAAEAAAAARRPPKKSVRAMAMARAGEQVSVKG